MKKLVFAAVAAIALTASVTFVSCDPKPAVTTDTTTAVEVEDSTVAADTVAADTVAADSVA